MATYARFKSLCLVAAVVFMIALALVLLRRPILFEGKFANITLPMAPEANFTGFWKERGSKESHAGPTSTNQSLLSERNESHAGPTNTSQSLLSLKSLAVVSCILGRRLQSGKAGWFIHSLKERGATVIKITMAAFLKNGHRWCGMRDPDKNRQNVAECPKHTQWWRNRVFARCPSCKYFLLANTCKWAYATALSVPGRTQSIITGCGKGPEWCEYEKEVGISKNPTDNVYIYDWQTSMAHMYKADFIFTTSNRPQLICPESLAKKMLTMWEYWDDKTHVSRETLLKRKMQMQERFRTRTFKQERFFIASGISGRDYPTLLKAFTDLQAYGVHLYILSRGRKVMGCTSDINCTALENVPFAKYFQLFSEALFVAVPLYGDGHSKDPRMRMGSAYGISVVIQAVASGKILAVTDTGVNLHGGLINNGTTGFLVGRYDVSGWRSVMRKLFEASKAELRAYEENVFVLADDTSRESLVERFITRIFALP